MNTEQFVLNTTDDLSTISTSIPKAQLVLLFIGDTQAMDPNLIDGIKGVWADSKIITCSTAGGIAGSQIVDSGFIVNAVHMENTAVSIHCEKLGEDGNSQALGERLASSLPQEDLSHVLLFSDGHVVNGTQLTQGMVNQLPSTVSVSGGLAGDGTRFERTVVGLDEAIEEGSVVAVGFYGDRVKVSCGAEGGWECFGPERTVTRSEGNVLFELDGQPALDLYKEYLADDAKELPGSALRFPLCLFVDGNELVRTILSVDEDTKSMTFAGDMPEGKVVRLMRCTYDSLISGAEHSIEVACTKMDGTPADLLIAVSCVGRRIVLGQSTEDELDALQERMPKSATITGFYSYGEIGPGNEASVECAQLHNQTMTVTAISEV